MAGRVDVVAHHTRVGRAGTPVASAACPAPPTPASDVDERRRRLLELGTDLFARFTYDELSMARIAREAGISKALLYHYFPSKQAYFAATLEEKAGELAALYGARPRAAAARAADRQPRRVPGLGRGQPRRLRQARALAPRAIPEVREVVDRVRELTAARILDGIAPARRRAGPLRAAVRAWLWFMDGAILDWIEHARPHARRS